ncbi:MAG: methyltransferase [Nanoarchaeota archaeon]|nr:methyltransferase [Nanoarchaeota archaeon]
MTEHYYSPKQSSKGANKKIPIRFNRKGEMVYFELYSAPGIFGKDKLDNATKLLIENAKIEQRWKLLDLGCGYGVVGLAMKRISPDLEVWMSDVNERAIELAEKNANKLKLDTTVISSDIFSNIPDEFDCILLNPPYAAGRKLCFKMINDSFSHLKKKGWFQLVARHNKGGKVLGEYMHEIFGNVDVVAKKGGFRVYISQKTS